VRWCSTNCIVTEQIRLHAEPPVVAHSCVFVLMTLIILRGYFS
jgi:hypothetical protein